MICNRHRLELPNPTHVDGLCPLCLQDALTELSHTFDLRWAADQRAIKRWREANPGNELVIPDHADLVVWLMERHAKCCEDNVDLQVRLGEALQEIERLKSTRSGDFHTDAVKEVYEQSAQAIEDYDRREAAGEDMSGEVRPRMPGGSDF